MAGNMLRHPVAESRTVVLDVIQIEPAKYRAVLGDEHVEGADTCLLLSQQGAVPVGELVEEVVAAVGDRGGEVGAVCQLEGQDRRGMTGMQPLQLGHCPTLLRWYAKVTWFPPAADPFFGGGLWSGQSGIPMPKAIERLRRRYCVQRGHDGCCAFVGACVCRVHGDVVLGVSVDRGLGTGQPDRPVPAIALTPVEFLLRAANFDQRHVVP